MLSEIRIQDLGVIEDAVLDLGPGLTVLTGETGAGKTMVVTALGLLLGVRGDAGLVRVGAQRTVVEGIVEVPVDHPARRRAIEAGAADEDLLILLRTVGAEGRSRAHVGGRSTPVGVLAEIGQHIVAVHGQADQWRLRRAEEHRELLDRHGWASIEGPLTAYREVYAAHRAAAAELTSLTEQAQDRAREAEHLTAALERLEALDLRPGEDRALAIEAERLGHLSELRAAAGEAALLLAGPDETDGREVPGAMALISRVRDVLTHAMGQDPLLADFAHRVAEVGHLATDLASDLSAYLADLDVDPARLDHVQERRAALSEVTRLYGPTVDDVIDWSATAAERLAILTGDDDRVESLSVEVRALEGRLREHAETLSRVRRAAAEVLTGAIGSELASLAMPGARVVVEVTDASRRGPDGADDVELLLAAGAGSELRPVTKAASGGELSRIMLAIEVATAQASEAAPTFVFDEVDAGIGGRAALAVGARLAALAARSQVIVVTHLAQVAAHADRHLVVLKTDDGQVTRTGVARVEGEGRIRELARMLAGTDSEAALEHARDLLAQVRPHTP